MYSLQRLTVVSVKITDQVVYVSLFSLPSYHTGDLVVLSDYIDWTKKRVYTHVGNAVKQGGPRG